MPKDQKRKRRHKVAPDPVRRPRIPGLKACEDAIGIPAADWPGRCFEIARSINRALALDWQVADTNPLHGGA